VSIFGSISSRSAFLSNFISAGIFAWLASIIYFWLASAFSWLVFWSTLISANISIICCISIMCDVTTRCNVKSNYLVHSIKSDQFWHQLSWIYYRNICWWIQYDPVLPILTPKWHV
jgi:hypothetical protein